MYVFMTKIRNLDSNHGHALSQTPNPNPKAEITSGRRRLFRASCPFGVCMLQEHQVQIRLWAAGLRLFAVKQACVSSR